jgi:hypothetical protein
LPAKINSSSPGWGDRPSSGAGLATHTRQLKQHEIRVGLEEANVAQPPETARRDVPAAQPENVSAQQDASLSLSVTLLIAEADLAVIVPDAGWLLAWKPGTS